MRMISGFGYRNPEGYPDPTAYSAINNVEKTPVENKTYIYSNIPQKYAVSQKKFLRFGGKFAGG